MRTQSPPGATSPLSATRQPHTGRWPRTSRLVWRERIEEDENGNKMLVWDEVWTRPNRKFGRSKEGRLRQVGQIPSLAPHFPRLLRANPHNGVLTLGRPEFARRASLAELDVATIRRLKSELRGVYSALYDNAIAYIFSPDGFEVFCAAGAAGTGPAAGAQWHIYIDGWNRASRHKVREPGAKKTAYFAEMEAEQLKKIEDHFAPFESRAKQKISAVVNSEDFEV